MIRAWTFSLALIGLVPAAAPRPGGPGAPGPPAALLRIPSEDGVGAVAFSADGKTLAWTRAKAVCLVDVGTGKTTGTLTGHTQGVNSVAFSPDGKTLASGSYDGTVRLWEAAPGKELRTLTGHRGGARCVAFSPDGRTLISADDGGTIRFWEVATGKAVRSLGGGE